MGGGLGGLVAAVAAREAGFEVTLHEARRRLGGRARTTGGRYRANSGPHVLYADGPVWPWLERRGLAQPAARAPWITPVAVRVGGRSRLRPPAGMIGGVRRLRRLEAPVDRSFTEWATEQLRDDGVARVIANFMGVATFDHDPGRLSAAFVNERLRRVTSVPPQVRYVHGGWATLVDRLAGYARGLGVRIVTESPVDRLPKPPVILALPLASAALLLGDATLRWTGTRTVLLDLAMRRRRLDPFILSDLDASGWVEIFSRPDPSLAPVGEQLVQAQAGLRPDEHPDDGIARLEALVDAGFPRWRARETWRRRLVVENESGALDLPGATWRDRPAIDGGDGVLLAGDMVSAPGLLGEVAFTSALEAVAALDHRRRVWSPRTSPSSSTATVAGANPWAASTGASRSA